MSNRIHALAQQLTGKTTLEECSVDDLRHITERHPYFAAAQFLLLQKLKQLNSQETEVLQKKAVLFYHDPLLFEYFISSEKFYVHEMSLSDEENVGIPDVVPEERKPIDQATINEDGETINSSIHTVDATSDATHTIEEIHHVAATEIVEANKVYENFKEPISKDIEVDKKREDDVTETIQEEIPDGKILFPGNTDIPSIEEPIEELTFEPYHTIDYFASQGIKISQEELPKDKLGKQLKSFTAWLKTMKRLPATRIVETGESSAGKKIESMADSSITETDIVTEAMAEVWAKQGNSEKAMETYNKLSLLNPSKTAYFAAKIEHLKHS